MAEQPSRRPTGPRRGRTSLVQSIVGSILKVWYGFWYYLTAPLRWFGRRRPSAATSAAATTGRKLRYYLFLPFNLIGTGFRRAGYGIRWWWRSTSAKFFLQSLPAIVVGLGAVATAVVAYTKPTGKILDNYKRSGLIAMGEQNYTVARICYSRLVQMQGSRPDLLYQLALAEEGVDEIRDENTHRAYALMDEIAPDPRPKSKDDKEEEKPGNYKAHLWKAKKYLAVEPPTQQSLILAGYHFGQVMKGYQETQKRATTEEPPANSEGTQTSDETTASEGESTDEEGAENAENPEDPNARVRVPFQDFVEAAAGLYDIHMKAGQLQQAQPFLQFAQQQLGREELRIVYFRSRLAAQPEAIRRELPTLRDQYTQVLEYDPGNTPVRLALAETYRLMDDYNNAERILVEGTKLGLKDEKDLHISLANLYTIQLQRLGRSIKPELQLQLVQAILDHDPGNVYMLERLLAMSENNDSEAARQSAELISKVIASGPRNPIAPTFHLIRGNYCFAKGEDEKGRIHIQQAFKLNSQLPELANSYAWLIAITPPFQLERALKMINIVIENSPENPKFRDTRGQILTRLGKYEEALKDLEFAVKEMPNSRSVHRSLEYCYRNLGMKEKADDELAIAKKLDDDLTSLRMAQADKRLFGIPAMPVTQEPISLADDERLELYERLARAAKTDKPGEEITPADGQSPPTDAQTPPAEGTAPTEAEMPAETQATPEIPPPSEPAAESTPPTEEPKDPMPTSGDQPDEKTEPPATESTGDRPLLPQNDSSDPLPQR